MNLSDIERILRQRAPYSNIFIHQFTWGGYRVDGMYIDLAHRWIRGLEIKMSHEDFVRDKKYVMYTEFCSTVSIVCPEGIVNPDEVKSPFGLAWVLEKPSQFWPYSEIVWKRKPKNVQKRDSLAWLWTYVHVLEIEFPRMHWELTEYVRRNHVLTNMVKDLEDKLVASDLQSDREAQDGKAY